MKLSAKLRRQIEERTGVKLPARRKYRNVPTVADGILFQSKKEAERWVVLKALEKVGKIFDLCRQKAFLLGAWRGERGQSLYTPLTKYVADFCYIESGVQVVEDVKSKATMTPMYKLKKRWMQAQFGVEIREI